MPTASTRSDPGDRRVVFPTYTTAQCFISLLTGPSIPRAEPTLAYARVSVANAGDEMMEASLLAEIDALTARYGEDCPLIELVSNPPAYGLASRVLPFGYRRLVFEAHLANVLDADPSDLLPWLEVRAAGADQLADVRIRVLSHDGNRLRLEITGDAEKEATGSHEVENPMVPSEDVWHSAGCERDVMHGCGWCAGGFTLLCRRCREIHEAQLEILTTF